MAETSYAFQIEGLDHVALAVRDVARSVAWSRDVLGFERLREEASGDHPAMVGTRNTGLALFPLDGSSPHQSPSRDTSTILHVAFRVSGENFSKAREKLRSLGIGFPFQDHQIAHSIYF